MLNIPKITLTAGLLLALAFISSCIPNDANEDEYSSSSSAEENSSSSTEHSSPSKVDNCYWYEDGNGKYDYKCGFEPPCYKDPNCPMCDVCYPYPTECAQNDLDRQTYKCRDVSNPGQFKLVGKDHCCGPSYCYSEGNEPVLCDDACYPPITVGLNGIESLLPLYTCYVEKRSSSSEVNSLFEEYGLVLEYAAIWNDYMPGWGWDITSTGERASLCTIKIKSATSLHPSMKVSANIITNTVRFDNVPFSNIYDGEYDISGDYRPKTNFRVGDGDKYTMEIIVEIDGKRQIIVVEGIVEVTF